MHLLTPPLSHALSSISLCPTASTFRSLLLTHARTPILPRTTPRPFVVSPSPVTLISCRTRTRYRSYDKHHEEIQDNTELAKLKIPLSPTQTPIPTPPFIESIIVRVPTHEQVATRILNASAQPSKAVEIFQQAKEHNVLDGRVYTAIITVLCKANQLMHALMLLEQMEGLRVHAETPYVVMVTIVGTQNVSQLVMGTLRTMVETKVKLTHGTYLAMLNLLAVAQKISDLRVVLQSMVESKVVIENEIHTEYCIAFARCKQYNSHLKAVIDSLRKDKRHKVPHTQESLQQIIFQRKLKETKHDVLGVV